MSPKAKNIWIGVGIFFAIGVVGSSLEKAGIIAPTPRPSRTDRTAAPLQETLKPELSKPEPTKKEAQTKIEYEVVKVKEHPNGAGQARVIVISPDLVNDADLGRLGEQLHEEAKASSYESAFIFDDKKAAGMRDKTANLSKAESVFYWKHHIGSYRKDPKSGALIYSLERTADGETKRLEY